MFDLLIKGATVVDGSGAKPWVGDVAIEKGRFAALDHRIEAEARRVIPAGGYVLAPGFIDIHCHSDVALFDPSHAEIKLKQGVTLDVLGNCGDSLAPLEGVARASIMAASDSDIASWDHPLDWSSYGEYIRTIEQTGLSMNVMGLVGHGTLRLAAMGHSDKAAHRRADGSHEIPAGPVPGGGGRRHVDGIDLCPRLFCRHPGID